MKADNNPDNPRYSRTVEFQKVVGIRKSELKKLQGRDLRTDESGYLCVFVKNGKGGKDTLQRILPENIDFLKSYFEGKKSKEKIFNEKEFSNSVDYHHLRAVNAQKTYEYYIDKIKNEKGYKEKLVAEIRLRWELYCTDKTKAPKPLNERLLKGKYRLRSKNREMAIEKGLPTEFDQLAVTAVSIFHLSHWRNNVTMQNYLLSY